MNRKLRKLLRNPKRFFVDLKLFGLPGTPRRVAAHPAIGVMALKGAAPVLAAGSSTAVPAPAKPRAPRNPPAARNPPVAKRLAVSESRPPVPENPTVAEDAPLADTEPTDGTGSITGIAGYEHFALHGAQWLEVTSGPVAVLWGFAAWQRDFVAQYLPESRVAFAKPDAPWPQLQENLDRLEEVRFIAWGHWEDEAVREYASRRGIAISRMGDGFIRSVSRSIDQTLPCSMVLDESGLYSNPAQPSDLEGLLNNHDFSRSRSLLNSVPALMHLHRRLGISKYNIGSFQSASRLLGPKLARRILVVGEIPRDGPQGDASTDRWTAGRLVDLALAENPQAEVIFRPHPDDAAAYRKDAAAAAELGKLCRLLADDVPLADVLRSVDHVYVDTSLVGMEALIHGVPVTVVGTPFYAGWGLTDDRRAISRRTRQLGLEELYCAVYLLYPRYLADLDDPVAGCLATMLRVAAERRQALDSAATTESVIRHAATLANTDYWPTLLRPENLERLGAKHGKKLLRVFSIQRAFADCRSRRFQRSVAYLIVGQFRTTPEAAGLLPRLRKSVPLGVYRQVLLDLWRVEPSATIVEQLAWCCERAGEFGEARALLEHYAFGGEYKKDPDGRLPFAAKDYPRVLRLAQFELSRRQFRRAEQLFNWLLLSGCMEPEVFAGLVAIAHLRFDFAAAASLAGIARRLHPAWEKGAAHVRHAETSALTGDGVSALESRAVACLTNLQHLSSSSAVPLVLNRQIGVLPYEHAMLVAMELGESGNILTRAKGLIAHERYAEAERLLLSRAPRPKSLVRHALTLSLAYSYQGKMADAMALISRLLTTSPTLPVYREALRLAVAGNEYGWGRELLVAARELQLEVGHVLPRKIALGLGEIREAYVAFRRSKRAKMLRKYLGDRYVQSLDLLNREPGAVNLVVASLGPGDEIRYATIYRDVRAAAGDSRVIFTCDPRLLGLLSRHYTELEFVPTARIRDLARLGHFNDHDQLAGSDLHPLFDNRGWAVAKVADMVTCVNDALADVLHDYACFRGRPCLKADPALVQQWRHRLPRRHHGELLVGLSWRSSLMSFKRNEHYLSVEHLLPLFELEGVRLINLQYDDCREEVAWLEERFPGRLLNFEDLDQFNDLEGVAALMECLDLVVSAGTAVVELAGALGRPTMLLTNSSEAYWRKIPGTRVDVWQNSIVHVEAPVLGDKEGLVRELASEIRQLVATQRHARNPEQETLN